MRPGRLDRILYVSPPDLEARKQIFRLNFAKMAVNEDVDVDELAELVRPVPLPSLLAKSDAHIRPDFSRRMAALAPNAHRFARMPLFRP